MLINFISLITTKINYLIKIYLNLKKINNKFFKIK